MKDRDARPANLDRPPARWLLWPLALSALLVTVQAWHDGDSSPSQGVASEQPSSTEARLLPTAHLAVPPTLEAMWYVPQATTPAKGAVADLARGAELLEQSGDAADTSEALRLVSNVALEKLPIADYARYYRGVALQRLNRPEEADAAYAVGQQQGRGAAAALGALPPRRDPRGEEGFRGRCRCFTNDLARKPASTQIALVKLGAAASAAGDRARAIEAHRRVLREFPLDAGSRGSRAAARQLGGFALDTPEAVAEEFGRAEALFKARKWDQAQQAFTRVSGRLEGEDSDRATLRLAQIQAANGQHRQARGHLPSIRQPIQRWRPKRMFGILAATRALGADDEFKQLTDDFVARIRHIALAEEALNELARHYVLDDDDGKAAEIYTRMIERFPVGGVRRTRGVEGRLVGVPANELRRDDPRLRARRRELSRGPTIGPRGSTGAARAYEQLGDRRRRPSAIA